MRRFVFILMIFLLPLRGWMGEAMATEMATIKMVAIKAINISAHVDLSSENGMSDCDMHKSVKVNKAETSETKSTCTHCQACHAAGLVSTVQISSFDTVQYAQPLAQASQFASADLALGQKPPIF